VKYHLFRLVIFNKTIVHQNSVETLHNNRNSLKQKKKLRRSTDTAGIHLPRLLNRRWESYYY